MSRARECVEWARGPAVPAECDCGDADNDSDVDLADFAGFQVLFTEP